MLREKLSAYREVRQDRKEAAQQDYDNAPERPLDELITDDKEILGVKASNLFTDSYRRKADYIVKKIDTAEKHTDTLGHREKYIQYRKDRTRLKIDRVQEKLDNSSSSFLSKQINRQRRQKIENLEYKQKVRTKQAGELEKKRKNKPEELKKEIDRMVNKKVDAMYRKAQRKILKDRHEIGRHQFVKRAEFLAKMPTVEKQRILREAILLTRKKNIKTGRLVDTDYLPDPLLQTRKVSEHYERTVE